jgi:hypothetical protein
MYKLVVDLSAPKTAAFVLYCYCVSCCVVLCECCTKLFMSSVACVCKHLIIE